MESVILASPRKHWIADEDMQHAYRKPIRVFDLDDLTLVTGASRAGEPLEGLGTAASIDSIAAPCPHAPGS